VQRVRRALKEYRAFKVILDRPARLVTRVRSARPVLRVIRAPLDPPDHRELLEIQDLRVQ
jgi:hypothetical protein